MIDEDMLEKLTAKLTFTIKLKVKYFFVEMYSFYPKDEKCKVNHVSQ